MEIRVRGYGKSYKAGYDECDEMWREKIRKLYNEYKDTGYFELEEVLRELLGDEK